MLFRSVNDPIHWKIEQYLKSKGLFYDRRKNYYKNQRKSPADIVSVPFLSQCLMTLVLQKPDYARARPSTLLTNDSEYSVLFSENTSLDTYFKIVMLGKLIERIVKSSSTLTLSQKNDLLFYVLYFSVAQKIGKKAFGASDICALVLEDFSDEYINSSISAVFKQYVELGGNGRVAKGVALKEKLFSIIDSADSVV